MGKLFGGGALLFLALFMFLGFLKADISGGLLVTIVAFLIAVFLPAGAGTALIYTHLRQGKLFQDRKEKLLLLTLESEIMKLASRKDEALTEAEVVSETSFDLARVKIALESLVKQGLADVGVTEQGNIVYTFPKTLQSQDKSSIKGILDE